MGMTIEMMGSGKKESFKMVIGKTYHPIETLNRVPLADMEKTRYICIRKNNR